MNATLKAYGEELWDDAISAFNLAYEAHSDPKHLFNIGRCYEGKDDLVNAVRHLRRFVDEGAGSRHLDEGKETLAIMLDKLGLSHADARIESKPPGARVVLIAGKAVLEGVTPFREWLTPGEWTLKVSKDDLRPFADGQLAEGEGARGHLAAGRDRAAQLGGFLGPISEGAGAVVIDLAVAVIVEAIARQILRVIALRVVAGGASRSEAVLSAAESPGPGADPLLQGAEAIVGQEVLDLVDHVVAIIIEAVAELVVQGLALALAVLLPAFPLAIGGLAEGVGPAGPGIRARLLGVALDRGLVEVEIPGGAGAAAEEHGCDERGKSCLDDAASPADSSARRSLPGSRRRIRPTATAASDDPRTSPGEGRPSRRH